MNAFITKKDLAEDCLLQAIRVGRYRPGDRLRQNEITHHLSLSSTPVREVESEWVRQVHEERKLIEYEISKLAFRDMTEAGKAARNAL